LGPDNGRTPDGERGIIVMKNKICFKLPNKICILLDNEVSEFNHPYEGDKCKHIP